MELIFSDGFLFLVPGRFSAVFFREFIIFLWRNLIAFRRGVGRYIHFFRSLFRKIQIVIITFIACLDSLVCEEFPSCKVLRNVYNVLVFGPLGHLTKVDTGKLTLL